jgi:host factor-I protein
MSQEFTTGFPSVRQIQTLIREKRYVEVKVITGDDIRGKLIWQDPHCVSLETDDQQKHQIWKQSIVYLKYA